jgi:hypothetical protein
MAHEIRPEHLGESKGEEFVSDVFEQLVFEESGEGGGAFGVAGRANATLFAAQRQQPFRTTGIAPEPGEACFLDATI